ncbi:NaMN--DMB phosphoribosyltransferase [Synechococcus sp. FACHB-909]|uniref:NaMN--DMB phosphoribosyltransferase n=1 Tax=Synechococcus sp. FACHB-909 TaxID=2692863 RepID=UPI001689B4A8|nr:NaMN--DMB phosphoribosyltransferase [Synechococcus sp. FACHB-909]MBD2718618.1 NaMN--DMB phosphoribosyltransferase [Synechococcus sp. FACHB-909]
MSLPGRIAGTAAAAEAWVRPWRQGWRDAEVLVLLAGTATAAVPGISAAGATPASRRRTAAADAELLVLGPAGERPHALPPLPAGVSPALISHVVLRELGLVSLVVDLGCPVAPAVAHLRLPGPAGAGPARCLSGGAALDPGRLEALLALGRRWGERLAPGGRPLLLAECVPGGTSTALAVLSGLGVAADGLVSGSLRHPDHGRKAALVARGLAAAGLEGGDGGAAQVAAAVGDPMQPLAAAMVLAAAAAGRPVLLAGGSQMAAVLALALALAPPSLRPAVAAAAAVGTTAWVAQEAGSDLALLLQRIGERWGVEPLAFAADLRFPEPCHPALAAYERGYVKEGVGAGGLALLWQLSGRSAPALARLCDQACATLLGPPPPTVR